MASSSTSSSERRFGFWTVGLVLVLGAVVVAELVSRAVVDAEPEAISLLENPPNDDVFIMGNSMFHTGVDMVQLADLTQRDVAFSYHNGHYSSLWYLLSTNVLPDAETDPQLVVWGFRPAFAERPAFRQNRTNDNDLFEPGDNVYRSLTLGSGDVVEWWELDTRLGDTVRDDSRMFSARPDLTDELSSTTATLGIDLIELARADATADFRERLDAGSTSVTDEILRIATGGEIERAEERVVDTEGDFIRGPSATFADSFIPQTAEQIADLGLNQLVVIWKPVSTINETVTDTELAFRNDARAWLTDNDIDFIDFFDDPGITPSMFAAGDHYNADGRDYITQQLADAIR